MNMLSVQQDKLNAHRFGWAWIFLTAALGVHVTDEAMTGFLSVYNPAVGAIREQLPFLPLPRFTFGMWLTGLCIGIALLFYLSPLAFHGNRVLAWVALVLSIIMFGNGLLHIGWSLYLGRFMPGVYSSPLLLLASIYLFINAQKNRRQNAVDRRQDNLKVKVENPKPKLKS